MLLKNKEGQYTFPGIPIEIYIVDNNLTIVFNEEYLKSIGEILHIHTLDLPKYPDYDEKIVEYFIQYNTMIMDISELNCLKLNLYIVYNVYYDFDTIKGYGMQYVKRDVNKYKSIYDKYNVEIYNNERTLQITKKNRDNIVIDKIDLCRL